MAGAARIPRYRQFENVYTADRARIRRLEVNHHYPNAGTAIYATSFDLSAADSWSPDFTSASASQLDQIGLTPSDGGVTIPTGWIAWVTAFFTVYPAEPPPTGEAVLWSLYGEYHSDVMANSTEDAAQVFGATVAVPSGWDADEGVLVELSNVSTYLGTEFTPLTMGIAVVAIQLPINGFPSGGPS